MTEYSYKHFEITFPDAVWRKIKGFFGFLIEQVLGIMSIKA
jgi:hypothetical protein